MRPSASARASVRIEVEVQRCARVLRHPAGQLVLDRPDEIGHPRPQCGVRLAFLQRRGQIDFRQRRVARPAAAAPSCLCAAVRARYRRAHRCAAASTSSRKRSRSAMNRRCNFVAPVKTTRTASSRPSAVIGMRAHFRLDRAKRLGLVVVTASVDEDLRPARVVRHNAPHLRYNPVCDLHNDRASLSAFSDAAALEIAGIDDPWIPRDDFEGVDVAERPIVVTARGEIVSRARRIVLMARAPASGMQTPRLNQPATGSG